MMHTGSSPPFVTIQQSPTCGSGCPSASYAHRTAPVAVLVPAMTSAEISFVSSGFVPKKNDSMYLGGFSGSFGSETKNWSQYRSTLVAINNLQRELRVTSHPQCATLHK